MRGDPKLCTCSPRAKPGLPLGFNYSMNLAWCVCVCVCCGGWGAVLSRRNSDLGRKVGLSHLRQASLPSPSLVFLAVGSPPVGA